MGIKDDYAQAIQLAKAGKLKEARNLLIIHDNPKVNALRERIEKAMQVDSKPPSENEAGGGSNVKGMVLAIGNVVIATVIVLALGSALYGAYEPLGYIENEALLYGAMFGLWLALAFIGHKLSKRLNR